MSVFLRWGVFAILAVAALVYAYNASKRMADARTARNPPAAQDESLEPAQADGEPEVADPDTSAIDDGAPEHCEAELAVAQRALQARREGEPLDRLLRAQLIAFENDADRRKRLEQVATRWYQHDGDEPGAEALRIGVISDCQRFSPAP